jgi:hypothetical protein
VWPLRVHSGFSGKWLSPAIPKSRYYWIVIRRNIGLKLLSVFFWLGFLASGLAFVSLLFPGSFFEAIWQLNPRAKEGFDQMGWPALLLMGNIWIACGLAAIGLWRDRRWGYWVGIFMLSGNLIGDILNVANGTEPRAAVGIPVACALLIYLIVKLREHSRPETDPET